jgi:hypothetical protein
LQNTLEAERLWFEEELKRKDTVFENKIYALNTERMVQRKEDNAYNMNEYSILQDELKRENARNEELHMQIADMKEAMENLKTQHEVDKRQLILGRDSTNDLQKQQYLSRALRAESERDKLQRELTILRSTGTISQPDHSSQENDGGRSNGNDELNENMERTYSFASDSKTKTDTHLSTKCDNLGMEYGKSKLRDERRGRKKFTTLSESTGKSKPRRGHNRSGLLVTTPGSLTSGSGYSPWTGSLNDSDNFSPRHRSHLLGGGDTGIDNNSVSEIVSDTNESVIA